MLNVCQHETGEEVFLPENCKQYTFNHRLNQSKHRHTHSCEKPAGKAMHTDTLRMPVGWDISQSNLLNQAAQNGLQPLWLGPREGEATWFSELSQIDKDIQPRMAGGSPSTFATSEAQMIFRTEIN